MDDLILFIDLDGTLKTDYNNNGPHEEPITVQSGNKKYEFQQRPHLHEFLEEARKKAQKVVLCTASGGGYARRVLKAMNIENYFTHIIAVEDFARGFPLRTGNKCIFIDNDKEMVDIKMHKLTGNGLGRQPELFTWVVDTYEGGKDDKTLLELIEEIRNL